MRSPNQSSLLDHLETSPLRQSTSIQIRLQNMRASGLLRQQIRQYFKPALSQAQLVMPCKWHEWLCWQMETRRTWLKVHKAIYLKTTHHLNQKLFSRQTHMLQPLPNRVDSLWLSHQPLLRVNSGMLLELIIPCRTLRPWKETITPQMINLP
jgi:hypothetical protein